MSELVLNWVGTPKPLKWYTYSQNNSGGSFVIDEYAGIAHFVIVQATDAESANDAARRIGLYFNGCDSGRDCSCCGDRWSPAGGWWNDDDEGTEFPMIFGAPAHEFWNDGAWTMRKTIAVHAADGRWLWLTDEIVNGAKPAEIEA